MPAQTRCGLCGGRGRSEITPALASSATGTDGRRGGRGGWHGTKGVFMIPDWCQEMSIILMNTHLPNLQHVDMWLRDMIRQRKAQGFQLLEPLAGYGHRVSMSESSGTSSKFGGAWLPQIFGERRVAETRIDELAVEHALSGIKQ